MNALFRKWACVGALAMLLLVTGCLSVPKASVDLSGELTQMIIHSRQSHLMLLDEYTSTRKAAVDKFMEEEWIPSFTANFVRESNILGNIQKAQTDEQKGAEMIEFAQAALPLIAERRSTLMDAVDQLDKLIRTQVEAHYQQMLNVNQALTAHLASAAKVVESREQLQRQTNVNTDTLIPVDKMNEVLEKMIKAGAKAEEIPQLLNDFKDKLNKARNGKTE